MEHTKCLGLYLSYNNATAVLLSGSGHKFTVHESFSVTADKDLDSQSRIRSLIGQIAKKSSEMKLKFDETTVSLDSAMYAQHDLQSEFTDHKQIASTIAFDAEEAVATDAMELAVTFSVTGTNQLGSQVTVFTSKRELMTEVLNEFKAVGMDPIVVEPDVVCLPRYIKHQLPSTLDNETLTIVLASGICYLMSPAKKGFSPLVRSFMVYPNQDIVTLLQRQIPITIASHSPQAEAAISKLVLFGDLENIDLNALSETVGLETTSAELFDASEIKDDINMTSAAIAYATAMSELVKTDTADFRESFMPFQGKKILLQKTLKAITLYLTILLIGVGVYFQVKIIRINNGTATLNKKFEKAYSDVMRGKKPNTKQSIASQLQIESNRVKRAGGGASVGDEKSIPAQLTYLLEVINSLPKTVAINVKDISISARAITIVGTTRSMQHALSLSKAIGNHKKLNKGKYSFKNGTFTISAEMK